jgi:hypothetical protein
MFEAKEESFRLQILLIINSMELRFHVKLPVVRLPKNFSTFHGTWRFVTMFTRALHWSLAWARSIQSIPPHPIYLRSILVLCAHLHLDLLSGFSTNVQYTFLFSPILVTCPAHLMLLDLIILIILGKEYKLWIPSLCSFSNLPSLHPSSFKIFSSAPFSQTPSVCVPSTVSEPNLTPIQNHRQNYSFVYFNFYVFRQQMKRWKVANITWIRSSLNSLLNHTCILICCCHSKIS